MAMTDPLSTVPAAETTPAPAPEPEVEEDSEIELFVKKWSDGRPIPPEELRKIVLEVAGLEPEDLPKMPLPDRLTWSGTTWQANQSPPGGAMEDFYIACIFLGDQYDPQGDHAPGDARVYVAPRGKPDGANFYVYTVNRHPNTGVIRARMGLAMFVEAVSDELEKMALSFGVLDEDDDEEEEQEE